MALFVSAWLAGRGQCSSIRPASPEIGQGGQGLLLKPCVESISFLSNKWKSLDSVTSL